MKHIFIFLWLYCLLVHEGDPSMICTDKHCKERFRDRLKLDSKTGSLTIMNTRTTDAGFYYIEHTGTRNISKRIFTLVVNGAPEQDETMIKSVKEGESVTFNPGEIRKPNFLIAWYFNNILIAEIIEDPTKVCSHQCDDDEGSRDRLELDPQTGYLTIFRTTDIGCYKLEITSLQKKKSFIVFVTGSSDVDTHRVSVEEGESVTLSTDVETNQQNRIRWCFNDILIVEITGIQSKICSDDHCPERFKSRLRVNHQTGSLTIMDFKMIDSGVYKLQINSSSSKKIFTVSKKYAFHRSVKEGESVFLDSDRTKYENNLITWYFNDVPITEITGNPCKTCRDDQCEDGNESFRDRVKFLQTGHLNITNTTVTDSGIYKVQFIGIFVSEHYSKIGYSILPPAHAGSVSMMGGDSVTLHTDVKINQQRKIRWYYDEIRIAHIRGDLSYICSDVQCNDENERFRDRLKLDHQTGSLTIMNTRTTDSGKYHLWIADSIFAKATVIKSFRVVVHGVSAALAEKTKIKTVNEGESVTLDPGEINTNLAMMWHFNDTLITAITGDQNKICTDDQCEDTDKRFRNRLEVNQTGSLTISNIRTTDSGHYKLQIINRNNSISISSFRSFSVNVTTVSDKGLSSAAVSGISAGAAVGGGLLVAAVAVVIYCCKRQAKRKDIRTQQSGQGNDGTENQLKLTSLTE